MLDEKLPEGDFAEVLQNGVILCKLMNKIQPESVKKFKEKVHAIIFFQNIDLNCAGSCLPPDGKCPIIPECSQEVRCAR